MGKCWTGKEGFATAWKAWRACKQTKPGKTRLKVYRCRCGQFHLTHIIHEITPQKKRDILVFGG